MTDTDFLMPGRPGNLRDAMTFPAGRIREVRTDVLVLGGGMAAYRAAIAARETGVGVTLAYRGRGASPYVIGFNAPLGHADGQDNPDAYIDDMVRGGYGLNDRRLVRRLAHDASAAYHELRALGVPFAMQEGGGKAMQRHLSGNSHARSVYVPEGTGRAVIDALRRRARALGVLERGGEKIVGLLHGEAGVRGALLWKPHSDELTLVRAAAVVMAMGGLGQLYADSTYPVDVAGDACAMAFEAGATLIDMEFMQFEPVVTVWPPQCRGMEMPTAMLGDGAQLRNASGERFMLRYNPPHAERHIEKARMALCIQREIDEGRGLPEGGVWFDATPLEPHQRESYVSHCARLRAAGVDPANQPVLVAPAAHSAMGGVSIDDNGWTGVPGLYAAGEAAGGVHGASRIAGNGCSDTLVFGAVAGRHAADAAMARNAARELAPGDEPAGAALDPLRRWHGPTASDPAPLKKRIREVLAEHAGIWRSAEGLRRGQAGLREIGARLEELRAADLPGALALLETERMARCAAMVLAAALARAESRGAHQRTDFPDGDSRWLTHLSFHRDGGNLPRETPIH